MKRTLFLGSIPAWLLLASLSTSCIALDPQGLPPTPQRPTLSSDTHTTAPDTFEVEAGVAVDPGDAFDSPATLKYGLDARTELYTGWSPLVHDDSADETGIGDVRFGVRHRYLDQDERGPSAATMIEVKLPTGDDDLFSGETDVFFGGILEQDFGWLDAVAYYRLGLLGDPDDSGLDIGHELALASSKALDQRLSVFAELAAQLYPEADYDAVFTTLGATWVLDSETVLDAGIVVGLTDDARDFQLVAGITRNLGRARRR